MNSVLVFGVGRSGTSTVARILHGRLGICMGQRFRNPDQNNPQGYFEDLDLKHLNDQFLRGVLNFPAWHNCVLNELSQPWRQNYWGFKDPRLCELGGFYLSLIEDTKVIRCDRNRNQVFMSMQSAYNWSENECHEIIDRRTALLDNMLSERSHLTIDFSTKKSDSELMSQIAGFLEK